MSNLAELNKIAQMSDEVSKDVLKLINAVTDEMSFIENDKFVGSQTLLGSAVGEGVISGYAAIKDTPIGIFATNPAVLKGSIGKKNAQKIKRCVESSVANQNPVIGIVDTSGARFAEGIEALEGYGDILKAFSLAYGIVPTICVIKGNNFGMLSYLSGICDCCIAFDKAVMATSSPLILASKTKLDVAKVGTAAVHSANGLIAVTVKNEKELASALAGVVSMLCESAIESKDDPNRVAKNLKAGSKAAEIIAESFDKGSFLEMRADYAKQIITGFARLNGIAVGVVAGNAEVGEGKLDCASAIKISELLNTCDAFGLPIVNIVSCGGVVNDLNQENGNLIREIGNLIYTYNRVDVPKIAMVTGNATGVGYTVFASKRVCDYTFAWADAKINVVDGITAANLLYSADIAKAKDKEKAAEKLASAYAEENCSAVVVASSGYLDNVIDPNLSRQYLIMAVQSFMNKV